MSFSKWPEGFERNLAVALHDAIVKSAEPLIEEAIQKAGQRARERVAEMALAMIDQNYSFEADGRLLRISVNLDGARR